MRRSLWMREAEQGVNVVFVPPCPGAEIMPWFNKPWAVAHWARSQPEGRIFALIDPDQFFLEALSLGRPQSQLLADSGCPNSMRAHLSDIPTPGVGIAQAYAIGGSWTRMQNVSRHCGGASRANCADLPSDHEANLHQSGGPPYLWVRDGTHAAHAEPRSSTHPDQPPCEASAHPVLEPGQTSFGWRLAGGKRCLLSS